MGQKENGESEAVKTTVYQPLGKVGVIVLLGISSAAPPIATDLFLPALPDMPADLGAPAAMVNLVLTVFFLAQGIGMFLFGPLSDKYGRRPLMIISLGLFCIGGLLCALAANVEVLIAARLLEGLGGGGMTAISTALVKDCFVGSTRQNALVAVQAVNAVAPLVAPLLGAAILMFTDWHGTFVAQAAVGAVCLVLTILLREPLAPEDRITGNPLSSFAGIGHVARNGIFMGVLCAMALFFVPLSGYITCVSYVYIDTFGTTSFEYSLFYAGSALCALFSTFALPVLLKRFSIKGIMTVLFALLTLAGVGLLGMGALSVWAFLVFSTIVNVGTTLMRPLSVNQLMDLHDGDTGSASALINFANTLFGCIGTLAISGPWPDYIAGMGILSLFTGLLASGMWVYLKRRF